MTFAVFLNRVISYKEHFFFSLRKESNSKFSTNNRFYLRLLNYMILDFYGFNYLSGSSKLIQNIIGIFKTEHQFSISRKYFLPILQYFSLLKKPQKQIIWFGLIPIILKALRNERQYLLDKSIQCLIALIMNLSLRRSSKTHFEQNKGQIIFILLSFLNTKYSMVKDYANDALYSLIQASPLINNEAINQQAIEKINTIIQETQQKIKQEDRQNKKQSVQYLTLVKQYHYIIDALTRQSLRLDQARISEDEDQAGISEDGEQTGILDAEEDDQQGQLHDIDGHDEDERLSIQSNESQYIDNEDQYLKGQELLLKYFSLLDPQTIMEQLPTKSALDENSRRIQNMTASISRSTRIKNTFTQQRPGTPSLLPNQIDR